MLTRWAIDKDIALVDVWKLANGRVWNMSHRCHIHIRIVDTDVWVGFALARLL